MIIETIQTGPCEPVAVFDGEDELRDAMDELQRSGFVAHPVPWTQVCLTRRA